MVAMTMSVRHVSSSYKCAVGFNGLVRRTTTRPRNHATERPSCQRKAIERMSRIARSAEPTAARSDFDLAGQRAVAQAPCR